jgi:type VI secretion system protein ImpE
MAESSAEDLLRDGHPDEALSQLQAAVRKNPADARLRTFLFQLLAVQGEWKRALHQLQVVAQLDAKTLPMVQTYREAIGCELLRERIFSGQSTPLAFGEPSQWFAILVEALRLATEGRHEESASLRNQAFQEAPTTSGTMNGQAFGWIADADTRLGPVLEVILNGRYYWMPFDSLQRLDIDPPSELRDVVWMPAHLVFTNGGDCFGLIPTRYSGTFESNDPLLRMSRRTEWTETGDGAYCGLGQRILATDAGEYALMDVREIVLSAAELA